MGCFDSQQEQRATRSESLKPVRAFSPTFGRFISWRGQACEPQPIALAIDVTSDLMTGTFGVPAESRDDDPVSIAGRVSVRYGWGAWGSSFVMDLRTGTFALPSCCSCEVAIELVILVRYQEAPSPLPEEVGTIQAAIIPCPNRMTTDRPTFTYRARTSAESRLIQDIQIPKRASSYRAWIDADGPETLVTRGGSIEPREWGGPDARDASCSLTLGKTLSAEVRNGSQRRYLTTIQFHLSP